MLRLLYTLLLISLSPLLCCAQEENDAIVKQGSKYVALRVKSLEKYDTRIKRQQDHLLKKLKKKEKRYANKLRKSDSAGYAAYLKDPVSFDSIDKLSRDTGSHPSKFQKSDVGLEKVKKAQSFIENKTGLPTPEIVSNNSALANLQGSLTKHSYINDLMSKRGTGLGKIGSKAKVTSLTGIQKQLYYGKSKMNAFKEMEEEPEKAEDEALEFLQGTEGFSDHMNKSAAGSGMQGISGNVNEELQKRGYQTKKQLQTSLEGKFGAALPNVGQNARAGLKKWQDKGNDVKAKAGDIKNARSKVNGIEKLSFKVNPMRGLPFSKRIEKQYGWQVTRANAGINQPAMMEPSAMYGFRHTPKLTYGVGASCGIGLGYGWDNIHFTYRGIGLRTFATWKWQYGISAYAGYERMYKVLPFVNVREDKDAVVTPHNNKMYNESVLIGLTKSYNLSKKYNGSMQLLYDIWWQQKGMQTPIVLRFSTIKM